ncbi:myb-like transcription factor, partial [Trifolium medium]|nr:myb-like transcription factor [Trifolium medium]
AVKKQDRAGLNLIWNAYVWVMWCARNDCVFNNKAVNIDEIVDQIKLLSWKWSIGRMATGPCLLYEWKWSPVDCFKSMTPRLCFFVLVLLLLDTVLACCFSFVLAWFVSFCGIIVLY